MPKANLVNSHTLEAHGHRVTFTLENTPIGWQYWTDESLPVITCGLRPTRRAALKELRLAAYSDIEGLVHRGLLQKVAAQ